MKVRAGLVLILTLASGCAELYRWPDRMAQRPRAAARPAPEPAAPEGHYVVKAGDTLYSIAFRNQLDFRELAVWNDIGPDYLIRTSQVLRLSPPPVEEGAAIRTAPLGGPPPVPEAVPPDGAAPRLAPAAPSMAASAWRWPLPGEVAKAFGNGSKGIDIAGELGQPVLAAAPGKVVYSGSALKGYGELVIIKHDDLHLSAYGYNRRRLVQEGEAVAAGQPVAEVGPGPEQKPVLHFEIREKGKPVNPLSVLPQR